MELFYADLSPYARKVRVLIEEKRLGGKIKLVAVNPYDIPDALVSANPLSKVPTLVLDDGRSMFESDLICEYLDATSGGTRLLPASGDARWRVLRRHALANGIIDAAAKAATELNRREPHERSERWVKHWLAAIRRALGMLEAEIDAWPDGADLANITTGCALGYLDVRLKDQIDWRKGHPMLAGWYEVFSRRPSMAATKPKV